MNEFDSPQLPGELDEIGAHLRENRYEGSALELDELKRRAMAQASHGARMRPKRGSSRLVTAFLALALALTGGSAVIASTSGSSSGAPSATASQYEQIVLPERIVPGSAKLAAPTGCVARAFNARVSGQNIARVVYRLDGKRIKTLTRPDSKGRFLVRIDPAKFKIGVHRIVATVTYKAETKKKAQTFRISFQRCAKKLAAPRFTG